VRPGDHETVSRLARLLSPGLWCRFCRFLLSSSFYVVLGRFFRSRPLDAL